MTHDDRPWLLALDLESVLVPEIWPAIAERYSIRALNRTTRDESDYAALMRDRLAVCARHGLRLPDLLAVVRSLAPLPGALELLQWVRARIPFAILSDTFYELASPLFHRLGCPLVLAHNLIVDDHGRILDFRLRGEEAKGDAVRAFQSLGYRVLAVGDSFNDLCMLSTADRGLLISPCFSMQERLKTCEIVSSHLEILTIISTECQLTVKSIDIDSN